MNNATRPAIFKWRQTAPELILCAVRWYLRYSLSLRDVEELFAERGLASDHTTIWRWVQRYGPELEQRLRRRLSLHQRARIARHLIEQTRSRQFLLILRGCLEAARSTPRETTTYCWNLSGRRLI